MAERSKAAIDSGGVLAGFTGVLVRDGYDHIDTATHAECGAHLLRVLKGVHDGDPVGQVWAEYMANTLLIARKPSEETRPTSR
jgi:transposase